MLILPSAIEKAPVMSLQTGSQIATIDSLIIDPRQLKVVAAYVSGPLVNFSPAIVAIEDIREISQLGCIVNSSENIMPLDDLVRLQEIINFNFELLGIRVIDTTKSKLGKVIDYIIDDASFFVQRLNVKRPLIKSLNDAELIIDRSQIVEVTNARIVVKAPTVPSKTAPVAIAKSFDNPFRKAPPQPENQPS